MSGSGNPAGSFCVGSWRWDTALQDWVWVGNCGPGIIGDPSSGYTTVPKPNLPPGSPPPPGGPTIGSNKPKPTISGSGKTGTKQPTPGAKEVPRKPITRTPGEGECGNPVEYDAGMVDQSRIKLDDWANLPEIWQEVNVPEMSSLTPEDDGTDPFVYKNQPWLRFLNGKLMVRRPGTASGARVQLPFNLKPHVALVQNRDEIPGTAGTLAYIIGSGINPDTGDPLAGIFGLGLAHPTVADLIAAGWKLKLDFTTDEDNPDACWIPVDENGVAGTSGAIMKVDGIPLAPQVPLTNLTQISAQPTWFRIPLEFADWSGEPGNSASVQFGTLPAGCVVHHTKLKIDTAFDSGAYTFARMEVGDDVDPNRWLKKFDVLQAPGGAVFRDSVNNQNTNHGATTPLFVTLSASALLSGLTGGDGNLFLLLSKVV